MTRIARLAPASEVLTAQFTGNSFSVKRHKDAEIINRVLLIHLYTRQTWNIVADLKRVAMSEWPADYHRVRW